jgi:hypothetical protein
MYQLFCGTHFFYKIKFQLQSIHSFKAQYHLIKRLETLHSAHTVYLCVPYGSHNKQRLFPQTALTGWAL